MADGPAAMAGWRTRAAELPWPLSALARLPRKSERAARRAAVAKARLTQQARAQLAAFMDSEERIVWPTWDGPPDVTAVLVVWNQPHLVLRSLMALRDQLGAALELVLVDNASDAETQALLRRVDGVTLVRNASNKGFLTAANQGAAAARAGAIVFVNSDAFPRQGAVAHALAALFARPDVGAVAGRVILPSGRVQEAGCIVWTDGATAGYGRGWRPDDARLGAPRDIDYGSGAFLMTRRDVWKSLGGFDPVYGFGYFEEADYCLRLWAAGWRVVYAPTVVTEHFEFGSEAKAGDAAHISEANRAVFRERHAAALARQLPASKDNLAAARTHAPR
ncbi:MAG TPA: glycosyltransferase family 2 protein [Caulobacteraceae bacterium]|jgi:GT2 family glycosyltransferase